MGMSASQARYLSLIAQQSDLEFQGQQINQSRTTLSDQTNNLYSQLQNLDVPTPPVTNDYTKIVYTTDDGAVNYKLGMVRPSTKKEGAYNIDLNYTTVGDSLQVSNTASSISYSDSKIYATQVEAKVVEVKTGDYVNAKVEGKEPEFYINSEATPVLGSELPDGADLSEYVKVDGTGYTASGSEIDLNATYVKKTSTTDYADVADADKAKYTGYVETTESKTEDIILQETDLSSYYVQIGSNVEQLSTSSSYVEKTDDGFKVNIPAGATLFKEGGSTPIDNPNPNQLKIGGHTALTWQEASAKYGDKVDWGSYEAGIQNTFGKDAKLEDFYFVVTPGKSGAYDVKLYAKEDIPTNAATQGLTAKGYTYETGTYTETANTDYVDIKFDSSGRISKITIPVEFDANGEPVSWKELDVTAKSETDNEAYENAMTKYEYAKYQYDKEQTEINAQMSIIQSQDKKLELKLQRLDNQRTQITTELEALKKVVGDNIEKTYKTFSG